MYIDTFEIISVQLDNCNSSHQEYRQSGNIRMLLKEMRNSAYSLIFNTCGKRGVIL